MKNAKPILKGATRRKSIMAREKINSQEYIDYFEDLSASGGLNFECDAKIGQKGRFSKVSG